MPIDTVGKSALKLWNSFTSKASKNIALAQKVAKFYGRFYGGGTRTPPPAYKLLQNFTLTLWSYNLVSFQQIIP